MVPLIRHVSACGIRLHYVAIIFIFLVEFSTELNMDTLDVRIIEILQRYGNLTNTDLASSVNSTESTCLRRVDSLKKKGILSESTYIADAAKLGRGLKAVISITTKEHAQLERKKFASKIREKPAINYAYGVTGDLDAVLIGNFRDMIEYQSVCD